MKRLTKIVLFATALALAATPLSFAHPGNDSIASGKDKEQLRTLNGNVRNKSEQPLTGSIVYLKNTKTLTVKSYIADNEGGFHFHALSPNVDYEVYAEYNGVRSQTKTLSSFDSRATVSMDLTIDIAK